MVNMIEFEFTDPEQFSNKYFRFLGKRFGWNVNNKNEVQLVDIKSTKTILENHKYVMFDLPRGGGIKCFYFENDDMVHDLYGNLLLNHKAYKSDRYQKHKVNNPFGEFGKNLKLVMRACLLDFDIFANYYAQDFRFRLGKIFASLELETVLSTTPKKPFAYKDTSFYCFVTGNPGRLYVINLIGGYQFFCGIKEMENPYIEYSEIPVIAELWSWGGTIENDCVVSVLHRCNLQIKESGSLFQRIFTSGMISQPQVSLVPERMEQMQLESKSLRMYPGDVLRDNGVLMRNVLIATEVNTSMITSGAITSLLELYPNEKSYESTKYNFANDIARASPEGVAIIKNTDENTDMSIESFISELRRYQDINYVCSYIDNSWLDNDFNPRPLKKEFDNVVALLNGKEDEFYYSNFHDALMNTIFWSKSNKEESYKQLTSLHNQHIYNFSMYLLSIDESNYCITLYLYDRKSIFFCTKGKLFLVNVFGDFVLGGARDKSYKKTDGRVVLMEILSFNETEGWQLEMVEIFDPILQVQLTRGLYYGIRILQKLLRIAKEINEVFSEYIMECQSRILKVYKGVKIQDKLQSIMLLMTVRPKGMESLGQYIIDNKSPLNLDENERWHRFKNHVLNLTKMHTETAYNWREDLFYIFDIRINKKGLGDISRM